MALRRCKRKSYNTRANVTRRTHGRRMTTTKNCNINKYVYIVLKADGGGAAKMPRAAATFTHMHILCSIHTNRGICGAAAIIYGLYPLSRSCNTLSLFVFIINIIDLLMPVHSYGCHIVNEGRAARESNILTHRLNVICRLLPPLLLSHSKLFQK